MTTTDTQIETETDVQDEKQKLRERWASIASAVDGDTIEGTVMDVREVGDEIVVEAETRLGEVTERYETPKPPLDDYSFTRVADEYGQGLVDVPALEGEQVPCHYTGESDSWSLVAPDPPLRERLDPRPLSLDTPGNKEDWLLLTFGAPVTIPVITGLALSEDANEFAEGAAVATLSILLWVCLFVALLLFL